MEKPRYIEVAVALPVHGTYTYEVPAEFGERAWPGMRLVVPFGKRRVTGYLIGFQDGSGGHEVKTVTDFADVRPLFPETMIPLFRWMSDYYIHPLGEVIRTALPGGLNRRDVSEASLTEAGKAALDQGDLSDAETRVFQILRKRKSCPIKSLADAGIGSSVHAMIRRLERKGWINLRTELTTDSVRARTETFVRRCADPCVDARLSSKRRAILELLDGRPEMSMQALKQEVPTAPALVRAMVGVGLVETFQKEVFRDPFGDVVEPDVPPELTDEQKTVVDTVASHMGSGFRRYLLHGVTGSGKTEVYLRLAAQALDKGRSVIVLVPEISLISQTERRFRARFGDRIAVLHSALSPGELLDQWQRIMSREAGIVIGPRSSIFAPLENPGIIIVDEEHDPSYKQETSLRYNARDVAVVRARIHGCPVLLGSATPSVQSYHNARQGRFEELRLTRRVNQSSLPEITLVDLKQYKDTGGIQKLITPELSRAVRECLDRGNQALIFLNRRGFSTYPLCESCGETVSCRHCDVTLTLHQDTRTWRCHLCGFTVPAAITCPGCGSARIKPLGFGTQKIEQLMKNLFPDARIARLDQDTAGRKKETVRILKRIGHRTVDIVVGTQMLAKGHDFPGITLVGVICADLSLNFPDFRAGERTFQLLAQVAGRAGRGDRPGRVIMQTFNPDHFSIETSRTQSVEAFYEQEIPFRKALGYPPFSRIVQLVVSGKNAGRVARHAAETGRLARAIIEDAAPEGHPVQLLGPIEAPIPKIASRYRWQLLLKSPSASLLNRVVKKLISDKSVQGQRDIAVAVDVDPYTMM